MNTDETREPIIGLHLYPDGAVRALRTPADINNAVTHIAEYVTTASVPEYRGDRRLLMLVDDLGHQKGLPVNAAATQLYGTGWPIVGDAILVDDDQRPLPTELVDRYLDAAWFEPVGALEWEDRHDDLDRNYFNDLDELEPGRDIAADAELLVDGAHIGERVEEMSAEADEIARPVIDEPLGVGNGSEREPVDIDADDLEL